MINDVSFKGDGCCVLIVANNLLASDTIPTNSPAESAYIFEGGTAASNYLERLIEVSALLI